MNKSNLVLFTLFTLTVSVVGWLGFMLTSQQDQQIKFSQINRSEHSLTLVKNSIANHLDIQKQHLSKFIHKSHSDIENNVNNNPLIHAVLKFNRTSELQYPIVLSLNKQKVANQWLKSIAIKGESQHSKKPINGWFIWHDQQKEKYIYWHQSLSSTVFIELNNAMFMAEFIHYLAEQPTITEGAYLQIIDNLGRIFYQWGNDLLLDDADFDIQKNLNSPLSGWSLRYFSKIESLTTLSKGLFQIIVVGTLILLSLITFILLKIKQREQQEAQQRLSFINQVSHELRTPLTNIRLHGDLLEMALKTKSISPQTQQSLTIIQQESERLSRLINNVLNFNQIKKNTFKLHCTSIDFVELMHQATVPFKPAFDQHTIGIELNSDISQPVTVDIDVVKQIIGNLLSNVEKYATESKIIRIYATINAANIIRITIQDQGKGIPKHKANMVFQPFYRLNSHLTDAAGSGLGLGLARELARLHGGDLILLKSKKGACFEVILEDKNA